MSFLGDLERSDWKIVVIEKRNPAGGLSAVPEVNPKLTIVATVSDV
jgi:hypothetical protein